MVAEWFFWLSVAFVVYTYFGYPALLIVLAKVLRRPVQKAPFEPFVSLIVPAYNEDHCIEEKAQKALSIDYPADKFEVIIVSDGSTDRTVELARKYEDGKRLRVLAIEPNGGKISALNQAVPTAQGEIIAFSDASSMPAVDSLRKLCENFADLDVGAVSGVYHVLKSDDAQYGRQEGFYWKYESYLKMKEAEIDSVLGCHGSLYAIRKDLYPYPASTTINDDYVIPLRILHKGWRVVYETEAVAYERAAEMGGFGRRVRIMAGNFEQLSEIGGLLWPFRWKLVLFFLSHKVGRLVVSLAMLGALVSNLFLLSHPLYWFTLAAQAGFYALAAAGTSESLKPKALRLPYYLTMINLATLFGFYYAFAGRKRLKWRK